MDKKSRILSIFYRLCTGGQVSSQDLADQYEVDARSIRRDMAVLRAFFSENRELVGDLELVRKNDVYYLNRADQLQQNELLLIIKILIGSRAIDQGNLQKLLHKLIDQSPCENRIFLNNLLKDEFSQYRSAGEEEKEKMLSQVWKLEEIIRRGTVIRIRYARLDKEQVEREVYPISVVFSEHYFYLLACRADKEDAMVIYYRLDRIKSITELEQKVPLGIERRYQLGDAKLYNQNMFMGERTRIRFRYTGPSLEAILDKFPTAEILRTDQNGTELTAIVEYSRGTLMELLSQGSWIQVLGPKKVVEDMGKELKAMGAYYQETV